MSSKCAMIIMKDARNVLIAFICVCHLCIQTFNYFATYGTMQREGEGGFWCCVFLTLWISFNKLGKSFSFWVRKVRPQEMCTNVNKQFFRTVCQFIWLLTYLSLLSNSVGLFAKRKPCGWGHCELNLD